MSTIFLTEKQLEYLMTGTNVRIDGTLAFPVLICPPSDVRDSCQVSYSLHRTIVGRLEADKANLQKAYDDIRVKYMRLTT